MPQLLFAAGWQHVLRFTWCDIVDRPDTVIARLRLLLGDVAA